MSYQIIATLGPAGRHPETWMAMISAGADAFRLNTSHLTLPQLEDWLERLCPFLCSLKEQTPLVLDLQGSKWRLGEFPAFEPAAGETVELVHAASTVETGVLPVPHADFFRAAPLSGKELLLNDAKIILSVHALEKDSLMARVVQGGEIQPRKGITYASSGFRNESLSEKDRDIFMLTRKHGFIRYAASYVRDGMEMAKYREFMGNAYLIAKLERKTAMDDTGSIARSADELWVCRGDLGAEMGFRAMAGAVSRLSDELPCIGIPVIMAGQVLEHMTGFPSPTRSEVCYLYDSLQKGYQGFVLSDETAVGRFPVESCRAAALFRN